MRRAHDDLDRSLEGSVATRREVIRDDDLNGTSFAHGNLLS
jgi:hypothetical protein